MAERYRQLLKNDRQYQIDCPVMLAASALLLDTQTQRVLAQLKMQSIVSTSITAVCVVLECFDPAGSSVLCHEEFWFQDLTIQFAEQFGQKTAIPISNEAVRKFTVHIETVVFTDGHTWSAAEPQKIMQNLPDRESLSALFDPELAEQFVVECKKLSGRYTAVALKKQDHINFCACGAVYGNSEEKCPSCGVAFSAYERLSEKPYLEERLAEYQEMQRIAVEKAAEHAEEMRRINTERETKEKQATAEKALQMKIHAKKGLAIMLPTIAALILIITLLVKVFIPIKYYKDAEAMLSNGNLRESAVLFGSIGDFRDAKTRCFDLWESIAQRDVISAGYRHTVGLNTDGSAIAAGYNYYGQCDVSNWNNIIAVSAGRVHTIGLMADGEVIATGDNSYGQCDVSKWIDIVAVSAGENYSIGLKTDGSMVATGDNEYGQCNVSRWTNIILASAGKNHTVGLKADGSVVATGDNEYGQCNVTHWKNIVAISVGDCYTVGLNSDGNVVATGYNYYGQCDVSGWMDIVAISAGSSHVIGLKADGSVMATGSNDFNQCDVSDWMNIVSVSAGENYSIGLNDDGRLVSVGYNGDDQCDVSGWKLW